MLEENKFQIKEGKDKEFIVAVIKKVEEYAFELEEEAAGANDVDPEAEKLRIAIEYYKYGLTREIPVAWYGKMLDVEKEVDPEYKDYLRMRKKFEGY
ncbi:hypothetical protein ACQKJG_18200 [Priestia megaterium]|uniref:hypothetical protein n=1 Tax=Priestia megaterium TaxID=1404 RepID=UPI003D00D4B8